jgi:hypothetical protein
MQAILIDVSISNDESTSVSVDSFACSRSESGKGITDWRSYHARTQTDGQTDTQAGGPSITPRKNPSSNSCHYLHFHMDPSSKLGAHFYHPHQ